MAGKLKKVVRRSRRAAKAAFEKAETRFLANQGRKAVRAKVQRAARVARKATTAGLAAGAVTAALVVRREARRKKRGAK